MAAKRKEIPVVTLEELGIHPEELAVGLKLTKMESPPVKESGKIIEDEPGEAAKKLAEFLRQDAKVI
jgi:electron transfer flavoprotein alpha/beta subunit